MRGAFIKLGLLGLIFCSALAASAQQSTAAKPQTAAEALARYEQFIQAASDPTVKFYLLTKAAPTALAAEDVEKARSYSYELLRQAPTFRDDWNYGNAIHDANIVLGHIAIKAGDVSEAKRFLLEAGKTSGSPQLNSFGPNMELAQQLLEKGEREAVLQYFDLCAKFWRDREGKLGEWKTIVYEGKVPKFGVNLNSLLDNWRFENWDRLQANLQKTQRAQ